MTVEFEAAAAICNMPALLSGQLTPSKLLLFELLVHYPHHLDTVMSSLPSASRWRACSIRWRTSTRRAPRAPSLPASSTASPAPCSASSRRQPGTPRRVRARAPHPGRALRPGAHLMGLRTQFVPPCERGSLCEWPVFGPARGCTWACLIARRSCAARGVVWAGCRVYGYHSLPVCGFGGGCMGTIVAQSASTLPKPL